MNARRRDWTVIGCVLLVAVATVTASFTAQSGLGELAGWTTTLHLFGVEVAMSWLLPVTVDAYGIAATRIATDKGRYSAEVRSQAFGHALAAVVVSVLGNAMYHLIEAHVIVLGSAAWVLVVAVSVVPPIALGGLAHLLGVAARDEVETVAVPANRDHGPDLAEEILEANRAHWRDLVEGDGAEVVEAIEPDSGLDEIDTQDLAEWGKSHGLVDPDTGLIDAQRLVEWAKERAASVKAGTVEEGEPGTPTDANASVEPPAVPALPVPSPAPTPVLTPAPDDLFPVAAARYADALAEGQVPALTRIKREMKVGQPRAVRIRTYLGQLAEA